MTQKVDADYHHPLSLNEGDFCLSISSTKPCPVNIPEEELDFDEASRDWSSEGETISRDGKSQIKGSESKACFAEEGEIVEKDETSVDLEDGEICDATNDESLFNYSCRYFQKGYCGFGKNCRFLHLTEKGLYSMFDFPTEIPEYAHKPTNIVLEQRNFLISPPLEETPWDRDLKDAMQRTESKKISVSHDKLFMTIQKDDCVKSKHSEFSKKERSSLSPMRNVRDSYNKTPLHAVVASESKTDESNRLSKETYHLNSRYSRKKPKTPVYMRLSPKINSGWSRSRSRSRSSSERSSCSWSHTLRRKRRRSSSHSRPSKNNRRRLSSSSKSSSSMSVSKKVSRYVQHKTRYRSSRATFKTSRYSRSPVKSKFSKGLGKKRFPDFKIDINHQLKSPEHHAAKKSSLIKKSNNMSCSDMSISPVSNSSAGKNYQSVNLPAPCNASDRRLSDISISHMSNSSSDKKNYQSEERSAFYNSSHRRLSDMSISPLSGASSPDQFSHQIGKSDHLVPKSSAKKLSMSLSSKRTSFRDFTNSEPYDRFLHQIEKTDNEPQLKFGKFSLKAAQKKSSDGQDTFSTCRPKSTSPEKKVRVSMNNTCNSKQVQLQKNDPLLMDLMKYRGNCKKRGCTSINAPPKASKSEIGSEHLKFKAAKKEKAKCNASLTKKEYLLKRLDEVNAAIKKREKEKTFNAFEKLIK